MQPTTFSNFLPSLRSIPHEIWNLIFLKIKKQVTKFVLCCSAWWYVLWTFNLSIKTLLVFASMVKLFYPFLTWTLQSTLLLFLFVWFDSLSPINNLSVIKGQVFLGWTSTKLRLLCLAQGHNAVKPVRLKTAAPWSRVKHSTTEPLRSNPAAFCNQSHPLWGHIEYEPVHEISNNVAFWHVKTRTSLCSLLLS